jgi:hypothetical protein
MLAQVVHSFIVSHISRKCWSKGDHGKSNQKCPCRISKKGEEKIESAGKNCNIFITIGNFSAYSNKVNLNVNFEMTM